jgi:hypothetical protein
MKRELHGAAESFSRLFVDEGGYDCFCSLPTGEADTAGSDSNLNEESASLLAGSHGLSTSAFFASAGMGQWSNVRGDAPLASTAATNSLSPFKFRYT